MTKHSYQAVFNRGEDIIEVVIRDQAGNKIDERRCAISDSASILNILRWIKTKYNANLDIDKDILSYDNEFFKF